MSLPEVVERAVHADWPRRSSSSTSGSGPLMSADSVTSTRIAERVRWCRTRAAREDVSDVGATELPRERLIPTTGTSRPSSCQAAIWAQAVSITQPPSATMTPVRSASARAGPPRGMSDDEAALGVLGEDRGSGRAGHHACCANYVDHRENAAGDVCQRPEDGFGRRGGAYDATVGIERDECLAASLGVGRWLSAQPSITGTKGRLRDRPVNTTS